MLATATWINLCVFQVFAVSSIIIVGFVSINVSINQNVKIMNKTIRMKLLLQYK